MREVDLGTATLRFDLGRQFEQQQFLTVLNTSIVRQEDGSLAITIPGAAIVQALTEEKETTLKWQLRAKPQGEVSEIVEQQTLKVIPAYSEAVAIINAPIIEGQLSGEAVAPLSALKVVTTDSEGRLVLASSANTSQSNKALGLTLQSFAQGDQAAALLAAIVVDAGWAWVEESPIYLGTEGGLTQTEPPSGIVRQVASPISSTSLYFEPDAPTKYVQRFTDSDLSIADVLPVIHGLNTASPAAVVVRDDSGAEVVPDLIEPISASALAVTLSSFRPIPNTWTVEVYP